MSVLSAAPCSPIVAPVNVRVLEDASKCAVPSEVVISPVALTSVLPILK